MFFSTSRLFIKGLFSLFLISSPLLVPASCHNTGIEALEEILKGNDLQDAQEELELARGRDCIVLLGEAGVGKSTLANAMCQGAESMVEVDEDDNPVWNTRDGRHGVYLKPKKFLRRGGRRIFQVGRGIESVTQYPQVAGLNGKVLCDCPGFGDVSGGRKDLINAMAIGTLLKKARRVKLCFLFSEGSLLSGVSGRQKSLKNMLCTLEGLLKEDHLSADYLKKVQIIITRPEKMLTKQKAIKALREMFEGLSIKSAGFDKMLENVMFVDAADRTHRFVDEEYSYWSGYSSPSQDTVAELKDKVCREDDDRWFAPEAFNYPLTKSAEVFLKGMLEDIKSKALKILQEDDLGAVAKIIATLKSLNECNFPGLNVSSYIAVIENYKNIELNTKEIEKLSRALESAKNDAKRACSEAGKKGLFQRLGEVLDKAVNELSGVKLEISPAR